MNYSTMNMTFETICENPDQGKSVLSIVSSSMPDLSVNSNIVAGMRLFEVCRTISVGESLSLRFIPAHQRSLHCDSLVQINVGDIKSIRIYPLVFTSISKCLQKIYENFYCSTSESMTIFFQFGS